MSKGTAVVWFDLSTFNLESSAKFYKEIFDWRFSREAEDYFVIQVDGKSIGTLDRAENTKIGNGTTIYFQVADLQGVYAKALAIGAESVREPTPMPGGQSSIAIIKDLDKNQIGLVTGK